MNNETNSTRENGDANLLRNDIDTAASDAARMQRAARWLDAESSSVDATTRAALARARNEAALAGRRQGLAINGWGGAGLGVALAASLAAVLVLPVNKPVQPVPAAVGLAALNAIEADDFQAVAMIDDSETALAEDLAFIVWLEENHDAG